MNQLEIQKDKLKQNISDFMKVLYRKSVKEATKQQMFQAVAFAIKDQVVEDWM